jgi:Relaxase/Mobilisation nuclease domain
MIAKIMKSAKSFDAVYYNEHKIEQQKAELLVAANFNSIGTTTAFISRGDVINYLNKISDLNDRVKNRQFHAVLSTKGTEYNAEELKTLAEEYIQQMGYADNPYLIYFHKDTDNNHVHIVSTRVNTEGVRIDDAFERKRSLASIKQIMEGTRRQDMTGDYLKQSVLAYKFSTQAQLEMLLENRGYTTELNASRDLQVNKNGKLVTTIPRAEIDTPLKKPKNEQRVKQLRGIFEKYKPGLDKDEFQTFLKDKFGVELVFHTSAGKDNPYGYTILDHATKEVFKGSEVMRLSEILKDKQGRGEAQKSFSHQETVESLMDDKAKLQDYLDKNDLLIVSKDDDFYLHDRKADTMQRISDWQNIEDYEGVFSLDGMERVQEQVQEEKRNLDIKLDLPMPSADEEESDRKWSRGIRR